MKAKDRMSFEEATRRYVHRFTMEHMPTWARQSAPNGRFYAPQYRSDQEWYDRTLFPPQNPYTTRRRQECHSTAQTWPLGTWLDRPYTAARP